MCDIGCYSRKAGEHFYYYSFLLPLLAEYLLYEYIPPAWLARYMMPGCMIYIDKSADVYNVACYVLYILC